MGKEQDLRYIRTQQVIKSAFLELMDTIGFEKITVQKLTEKAMINRSTFYLHYIDKFDLLDRVEDEMLGEIKNIFATMQPGYLFSRTFEIEIMTGIFTQIYEHIRKNHHFFTLIMSKKGDPAFLQKFANIVKTVLQQTIIVPDKVNIPEQYLIALVTGAQTSLIGEWLSSGMKETPDELAAIITGIGKRIIEGLRLEQGGL